MMRLEPPLLPAWEPAGEFQSPIFCALWSSGMSKLSAFLRKFHRTKRVTMRPGVSFIAHRKPRADLRFFCGKWAEATAEYDRFIAVARGKSRLLDVGAKHCVYSLTFCALNRQSRSVAIEPSRENIDVASANSRLNCFDIDIIECA